MARTVATEVGGDEETALERCPHPGTSLVGKPVRKLFEDPEVPEGFRRYRGAVTGVRPHDTFQQVYVVRYDDGRKRNSPSRSSCPCSRAPSRAPSRGTSSTAREDVLQPGETSQSRHRKGQHLSRRPRRNRRHGTPRLHRLRDGRLGHRALLRLHVPHPRRSCAAHDLLVRRILAGASRSPPSQTFQTSRGRTCAE